MGAPCPRCVAPRTSDPLGLWIFPAKIFLFKGEWSDRALSCRQQLSTPAADLVVSGRGGGPWTPGLPFALPPPAPQGSFPRSVLLSTCSSAQRPCWDLVLPVPLQVRASSAATAAASAPASARQAGQPQEDGCGPSAATAWGRGEGCGPRPTSARRVSAGRRALLHRRALLRERQPLHKPPLRAQPGAGARLHVAPGPALPQDRLLQHAPHRGRRAAGVGGAARARPAGPGRCAGPGPSSAVSAGSTTGSASGTSRASCSAAAAAPPSAGTPAPPWRSGRPAPRRAPPRTGCPTPAPPPPTRYESCGRGRQRDAAPAAVQGEGEARVEVPASARGAEPRPSTRRPAPGRPASARVVLWFPRLASPLLSVFLPHPGLLGDARSTQTPPCGHTEATAPASCSVGPAQPQTPSPPPPERSGGPGRP